MMPPKTFVVGMSGYIGRHLFEAYKRYYPDLLGSARRYSVDNLYIDMCNPDILKFKLAERGYREAIIAAAITNFKQCENEKEYTRKINVEGTLELARQLHQEGLKVIFFSSESVFDGIAGGYSDEAPVNPIFEYGRQKAETERRFPEVCKGQYLISRIGKTFGLKKGDNTLLDEMAQKLTENKPIRALTEQIFCPTLIDDIVEAVIMLQKKGATGIINICSPEIWSRFNLAVGLAKFLNKDLSLVEPMSFKDFGDSFNRPKRTNMVCNRLTEEARINFTPMSYCFQKIEENYRVN